MSRHFQGALGVIVAISLVGGSLAGPADARDHGRRDEGRGDGRGGPRHEERWRGGRDQGERWGGERWGGERRDGRRWDSRRWDRHYDRGHSDFWPFLGGVVLGTVIGNQCDAPPRRHVRSVVFVYRCDWCDFRCRGYDDFCGHLVCEHRIPRCDVGRWFRPNEHGSWEDDY